MRFLDVLIKLSKFSGNLHKLSETLRVISKATDVLKELEPIWNIKKELTDNEQPIREHKD